MNTLASHGYARYFVQSSEAQDTGRAWIELSMDNLRHNVAVLRALLPAACRLMPAVKANAYGHGAVPIARELNRLGVDAFCVASLQEGIELRQNGIWGEILVLGYTSPEAFDSLRHYNLTQTALDCAYAECLHAYGKKLRVHLKVDTGMHRLGEWYQHTEEMLRVFGYKNLIVKGMYTHLCVADDPAQREYTELQIQRFYEVVRAIKKRGIPLPKLHIQGSYGVLNCPDLRCDYARTGIAMYGMLSRTGDQETYAVPLRPVLSVKARVEMVQTLSRGEAVGYGLQFTAQQDMRIASVAIGYADGIPRALSCGVGAVLLHGKKAPMIGRLCMDRLAVDVTGIPGVRPGDVAVILGDDGDETISACDIASRTDSISNEVLSRLGARLPRVSV